MLKTAYEPTTTIPLVLPTSIGSPCERATTWNAWWLALVSLLRGGCILIGIGALSPGKRATLLPVIVYQEGSRFSISRLYWSAVSPALRTSAMISTGWPPASIFPSGGVRFTTIGLASCPYIHFL